MNDEGQSQEDRLAEEWYNRKSMLMEQMLGNEHDMVMHALIPYEVGGDLDLYYFPHGIPGTGIATKELTDDLENASSNKVFKAYELLMFTRVPLDLDDSDNEGTPFGFIHENINAILNCIAPYSAEATLNPRETCEFPADMEKIGGKCLIFDGYPSYADAERQEFGLLLIIEIFRSEMEFARENGGQALLNKLKEAGHYPYSDLDRAPVA